MANDAPMGRLAVVLFVDGDHAEHVEALRVAGYRVELAPSAIEALQRAPSMRPDALIVPLSMPDMTGSDLAHRIGTGNSRVHTLAVVILVPSDSAQHGEGGAIAAGATFCNLPCSPTDLVTVVTRQLAARRLMGGSQAPPTAH